jgi:hypothetical protein
MLRGIAAVSLMAMAMFAALFVSRRQHGSVGESSGAWPQPVRPATAVGDSTCLSCHRDKATYESTAHRLTTRHPTRESMDGNFTPGANVLRTPNPHLYFRMEADSAGFTQTGILESPSGATTHTERVAYVSGVRKGQSYLYWSGNQLYQLPVSYWASLGKWINSPGYVDGSMNFERAIAPRCLECHATWMEPVLDPAAVNRYDSTHAILGITCERCHGAGREHVARERSATRAMRALRGSAVANPATMSRERQMEACAQCHGGLGQPIAPPFTYVAGKPLAQYLRLTQHRPDEALDVHGDQVALLTRSRCYQASQMTCLTCHDVHRTQRDPAQLSERCLTCHQEQSCKLFPTQGHALRGRCVDCHMPLQPSNLIVSGLEGTEQRALVRNHWIKVYRDSVAR